MAHVLFIQELLKEFEQTAKGDAGRKIEKKRNAEVKSGKNAKNTDYDSGGNRFSGRETQSPIKVKVPTEDQMLSDLNDLNKSSSMEYQQEMSSETKVEEEIMKRNILTPSPRQPSPSPSILKRSAYDLSSEVMIH